MSTMLSLLDPPTRALWVDDPVAWWNGLTRATEALDPPYAVLALDALRWNAVDLVRRAEGVPIRVASKSVRCRAVLDAVLDRAGYAGVLAFTLPEALWLAEGDRYDDVVVGYPTADRAALQALAGCDALAARITLMVDDLAQLDLIDAVTPPGRRPPVRVCLELDASYRHRVLGVVGARRSPVREPAALRLLAEQVARRPGFQLVGVMAYEAQIAGVPDAIRGMAGSARSRVIHVLQRDSAAELAARRAAAVAAVREVAELEFVNGGGTGSIETTRDEQAVTEIAAGSGLFGPGLFDAYSRFRPAPATAFALSVVRRPTPDIATLLGGGWVASGPPAADRLPVIAWPQGLRVLGREGAGEVQTPVRGAAATRLRVGDRVWLRHAKAGELCERVDRLVLVDGAGEQAQIVGEVLTYRGEGKAFL